MFLPEQGFYELIEHAEYMRLFRGGDEAEASEVESFCNQHRPAPQVRYRFVSDGCVLRTGR